MAHDVVIFGLNKYRAWQHEENRRRSYFIMQEILKRPEVNKVLFIDYLPVKRAEAVKDYFSFFSRLARKVFHVNLLAIGNTIVSDKLYTYATVGSVVSWPWVYKDLKKVLEKLKFGNILIFSFDPLNVDFFEHINDKLTVFDVDIDWRTKESLKNGRKIDYIDVLRQNYNRMANYADFIFTASDELLEIFMGHDGAFWLPDQGIDHTDWHKLVGEMFTIIESKKA